MAGNSEDHRQGLGWSWILEADLANAGLVEREPAVVMESANQALEILLPIENWVSVARAYGARAQFFIDLGDSAAAAADRKAKQEYESIIESEEDYAS